MKAPRYPTARIATHSTNRAVTKIIIEFMIARAKIAQLATRQPSAGLCRPNDRLFSARSASAGDLWAQSIGKTIANSPKN
jgi:hypothetical protein